MKGELSGSASNTDADGLPASLPKPLEAQTEINHGSPKPELHLNRRFSKEILNPDPFVGIGP